MAGTVYATAQGLLEEFGEQALVELTDIGSPRTFDVDFTVAQRACDRANVEVEAAVSARHVVPLASVPELLRYLAQDLAHYYLWQQTPPTWVEQRFLAARKSLDQVRAGTLPLGPDVTGLAVTPTIATPSDMPMFAPSQKLFGRGAL